MKIFIVHAHPEPRSFNGQMKNLAVGVLREQGHEVQVSDLYAMKFKAVADRDDFQTPVDPQFFRYQAEQVHAHQNHAFAPDIAAEHEKLLWSDVVIFQFPLWWLSVPAILKGWFDRVLAMGFCYGAGSWFDRGGLAGRKAMCALTTGAPAPMFDDNSLYNDIYDVLFPVLYGTLFFVGLEVLPPFVAWSAARADAAAQKQYLADYRERLLALESTAPIPYRPLADYDERRRLMPGLESKYRDPDK